MRQDVFLSLCLYPEGIRQSMAKILRVAVQRDRLVLMQTSVKALNSFLFAHLRRVIMKHLNILGMCKRGDFGEDGDKT